jgi:hypothetical protein
MKAKTEIDPKWFSDHLVQRTPGLLIFDWLSTGPGLTKPTYDFECSQGLIPPCDFLATSIHGLYGTMDADDKMRFREAYSLEFYIIHKQFYDVPLLALPDDGVLIPSGPISRNKEMPLPPGEFSIQYAKYLPPLMPFRCKLVGDPVKLKQGARFLPLLNGLMDRRIV